MVAGPLLEPVETHVYRLGLLRPNRRSRKTDGRTSDNDEGSRTHLPGKKFVRCRSRPPLTSSDTYGSHGIVSGQVPLLFWRLGATRAESLATQRRDSQMATELSGITVWRSVLKELKSRTSFGGDRMKKCSNTFSGSEYRRGEQPVNQKILRHPLCA